MRLRSLLLLSSVSLSLTACFEDRPADSDAAVDASPKDVVATDARADVVTQDVSRADVVTADAATDASTDAATDASTDAPTGDAATDGGCRLTRALVTTTDYTSGGFAIGTVAPPALTPSTGRAPDQDHAPVQSGCIAFNLQRGNDVLAVLDPASLPSALHTIPLRSMIPDAGAAPNQVNPYDVLTLSPRKAYVVQYALSRIAIVDPTRDGADAITGSIDLAPVHATADTDPSPEAAGIVQVGTRAFVMLQNLSMFSPVANGALAVVDTTTDRLLPGDPIRDGLLPTPLTGRNPVAIAATPGGRVVVASVGNFSFGSTVALDGVIEAISAATFAPVGMRVTEMQLGGDLGGMVMFDDNRGWAMVTRPASTGSTGSSAAVIEFDLSTGTTGRTLLTAGNLAGIARAPDGTVWVLDRSTGRSGVRVLSAEGAEVTAAPLSTGALPPNGIAFVP